MQGRRDKEKFPLLLSQKVLIYVLVLMALEASYKWSYAHPVF